MIINNLYKLSHTDGSQLKMFILSLQSNVTNEQLQYFLNEYCRNRNFSVTVVNNTTITVNTINDKSTDTLKVGDFVTLNSGGPVMWVVKVDDNDIHCQWLSHTYFDEYETFPAECLTLIKRNVTTKDVYKGDVVSIDYKYKSQTNRFTVANIENNKALLMCFVHHTLYENTVPVEILVKIEG